MGDILTDAIMAGGIDAPAPAPKVKQLPKPATKKQKARRASKARAARKAKKKAEGRQI